MLCIYINAVIACNMNRRRRVSKNPPSNLSSCLCADVSPPLNESPVSTSQPVTFPFFPLNASVTVAFERKSPSTTGRPIAFKRLSLQVIHPLCSCRTTRPWFCRSSCCDVGRKLASAFCSFWWQHEGTMTTAPVWTPDPPSLPSGDRRHFVACDFHSCSPSSRGSAMTRVTLCCF